MNIARSTVFILAVLGVALPGAWEEKCKKDYLTLDEAVAALKTPGASAAPAETLGISPELSEHYRPPFIPIEPIRLFDRMFFVGTTAVGAFVVDTGDGLVLIDSGCGDADAAIMAAGMKRLGLDPAKIKLILISHEHFDHYGGVRYLKKSVCPDAKVAMSLTGWNLLQTVPLKGDFAGTRPPAVDVFLTDGIKIKIGTVLFHVIATPGHSAGCVSFIVPVTDHGSSHVAGIMGGLGVPRVPNEAALYKASIEYFKAFAEAEQCDAGLFLHSEEADFSSLRVRKAGEANPLVIGTKGFDSVYLQMFRDLYQGMVASGKITFD